MSTDAVPDSSERSVRVSRASLREQVTNQILTAVFQRKFVSDQRLVVQRLAEEYGVSPTPVRESLVELAGLAARRGQDREALRLLALPLLHLSSRAVTRERAAQLHAEIASRLPPDVSAQALEDGHASGLMELVNSLLELRDE